MTTIPKTRKMKQHTIQSACKIVLTLIAFGSLAGAANAALIVTEADFGGEYSSSDFSPTSIGTLEFGLNTISGSFDGSAEFDFVSVFLPGSLNVTSFQLVTSNVIASPGGFQASIDIGGSFDRLAGISPTTHTFLTTQLTQGGSTTFGIDTVFVDETRSFDYTWQIETIPEPTSATLLGLASILLASRRKRSA